MADFPDTSIPAFTQATEGEPVENTRDQSNILGDQDVTNKAMRPGQDDENLGASSNSLESLEDEPTEFMRGDIDVKEQMDRAADALDASLHGWQSQADEDDPRGDLGASFRDTPGGLEEVIQKTEEDLATRKGYRVANDEDKEVRP